MRKSFFFVTAFALARFLAGAPSTDYVISGNTPGFVKHAADLGPVAGSKVIAITAWLKLHNEGQLTQLLDAQRQKGNASYHKWINQDQFNAQFSPTAQEVNAVQNFLTAHNLTILTVAENDFYVKVQGTVADIEKAFHVQLERYSFDGSVFRSNKDNPSINDSSGSHVAAITGLDDFGYEPSIVSARDADGTPSRRIPLAEVPNGFVFEGHCWALGVESHTFSATGVSATYTGNRYGADINNTTLGHIAPCGYQPSEMYTAYNMTAAYNAGLDGTGETIVVVDAFGSKQVAAELAAFSQLYGLPNPSFTQLRAPGAVHNTSPGFGGGAPTWHDEIALDVEWSHAMAPGAKIILVVAPNNGADLDEAVNYAVVHHFGNTISNSWSSAEGLGNPARFNRVNRILMSAAAQGIDVNFSSGDFGDFSLRFGFVTVPFPTSSPWATGVGGTSLFLNTNNTIKFQTGWGTNESRLADVAPASVPDDPPLSFGFLFGAGGGSSFSFAKPSWQTGVPGTTRQVPDISLVADPFTGAEFVSTDLSTGQLSFGVIGGTSLACPMFSGMMAVAAQKHGHVGLGQVAPLLYGLPAGAITDVTDVTSASNVHGSILDAHGTTLYSAEDIAAPLDGTTNFLSAFYNSPFSTRWDVLTFGTDTSLKTSVGWDNVTGLGTPNGFSFINALAP